MDSTRQIEQRAAAWLTRRDSGNWTEADETGLQAWLGAATANRVAYLRLEMVWEETRRLKALAAGLPAGSGEANEWAIPFFKPGAAAAPVPKHSRLRRHGWLIAASLVLAVGATYFVREFFAASRFTTSLGVIASVPLQDGSSITLNSASRIRVDLNSHERHVELTRGEAFFDVARDAARPFIVTAGDRRIIAVGTKFSVRRESGDVRVVVTEGRVRIEESSGEIRLISAGTIARTRDEAVLVQKTTVPETEAVLSWRTGFLVFRDTPLSVAIDQFNQYNERKIVTADPAIATIPLTGKFKATNYDAFVRLLEGGYGIRAQRAGDSITLAR